MWYPRSWFGVDDATNATANFIVYCSVALPFLFALESSQGD